MECRRKALGWLLAACSAAAANVALAQTMPGAPVPASTPRPSAVAQGFVPASVPLDELPPPVRERVRAVLEHPTLSSRGPLEAFHCRPGLYYWLLDHPDLAVRLWRGLGAKCTDIQSRGEGSFTWKDAQNGEVHWQTVLRTAHQRVWYAEGRVRPGTLLPSVSIRAVVVLNHQEGSDGAGKPAVRHQMDLILHTDSRAVTWPRACSALGAAHGRGVRRPAGDVLRRPGLVSDAAPRQGDGAVRGAEAAARQQRLARDHGASAGAIGATEERVNRPARPSRNALEASDDANPAGARSRPLLF